MSTEQEQKPAIGFVAAATNTGSVQFQGEGRRVVELRHSDGSLIKAGDLIVGNAYEVDPNTGETRISSIILPTEEQIETAARLLCIVFGENQEPTSKLANCVESIGWRYYEGDAREHLILLLNMDRILAGD